MSERWVTFDGYEGRYDESYKGGYMAVGIRFPYLEGRRSDGLRTWDIVRVEGDPIDGHHPMGTYLILARGFDMMGKAYGEYTAYRRHFRTCPGVGVCQDLGHPGGPRRSRAQAMAPLEREQLSPAPEAKVPLEVTVPRPAQPTSAGTVAPGSMAAILGAEGTIVRQVVAAGLALDVIPMTFRLWTGPPLGMSEDCNKRGGRIIGGDDELSCAEVEIVRRLRAEGWDAAWVSKFHCGSAGGAGTDPIRSPCRRPSEILKPASGWGSREGRMWSRGTVSLCRTSSRRVRRTDRRRLRSRGFVRRWQPA